MAAEDIIKILNQTQDMNALYQQIANLLHIPVAGLLMIIAVIAIWSLVWKGLALWKSARKNNPIWFVVMLIINTVGILEILYIFVFSEMGKKENKKK